MFPSSLKTIKDSAFYGNIIETITIGDDVTISNNAFYVDPFDKETGYKETGYKETGYVPIGSEWVVGTRNDIDGRIILGEYVWKLFTENYFLSQYKKNNNKGGTYHIIWIETPKQPDWEPSNLRIGDINKSRFKKRFEDNVVPTLNLHNNTNEVQEHNQIEIQQEKLSTENNGLSRNVPKTEFELEEFKPEFKGFIKNVSETEFQVEYFSENLNDE